MQLISKLENLKFKYDSKEERDIHVKELESQGYECTGRIKNSDSFESESYWFAEFYKYG